MPRIFKFSKFALKLFVPNASHMEQMKILLYTDSYDIAVEYTKGFTINDNEVKVIVSNNDFNNMNDGVIKYRVEGYIDNNYYVEERQSNYFLKTPSDYTSSDLTGIKEIFQDNGEGIMIINAVDYGVDGFSSVEIDANEYGQTKYSDGYYAGETEQKAKLEPIEITKNGTYSREDGYNQIHVNIEGKGPVETTYKFIGNNGYFENTSEVIEIDNNYVKAISLKNDGELTTSFCPLSDGYLYYISSTQHGEFYVKIENGKLYVKISEREGSCDIELNKWHLFVLNFDYFTLDGNTIQLSEGSVPTSISTTWYMGGKYLSTTGEFTEPLHFYWEYSIMNYFTYYHYRYIYIPYQEGKIIRYYKRDSELSSTNTYDFVNGPIEPVKRVVDGFSPVEVCTRVDLASISVQPEFSNLEVTIDDTYYTPYEGINTLNINNKELAREVYYKGIESDEKSFKSGELTISENGEYINSDVEEFYSIWMLDATPYDGVWLLDDVMQQRIECRFRYTQEMLQGTIPWIFGKTDETNGFSNKNKFGLEVNGNDTEAWCNYWQNGKKQKIVFNYGEWVDFVSYPHPDYANKRVIECAGQYFEIDNPSMLNDNGRLKYCGVGALLSTDDNKEGQYIKNTKYLGELAYLRVTSNNVNVSYEPEYYPGADDVVLILRGSRWGGRIINYTSTKYIRKSKITKTWDKVIVDVAGGTTGSLALVDGTRFENSTFTTIPDYYDFSTITDTTRMFNNCKNLQTIPLIDTSNVTYMGNMFSNCTSLTTIPQLDTSNVTNMERMFSICTKLTTISQLDTSNVTNMEGMFSSCYSLQSIPELNTSNVTNMKQMFKACYVLTTIPQLDTSNVTNMREMFSGCKILQTIPLIDTSNVTNMEFMFSSCELLQTIPQIDTSNVTNMGDMFNGCTNLKTIPELDTSNVTNMNDMFFGCRNLQTLPLFDARNVTDMGDMFFYTMEFLTDVGGWINLSCDWNNNYGLACCPNLTYQSCINILNGLADVTEKGGRTLNVHQNFLGLVGDEVSIGTDKGWIISA